MKYVYIIQSLNNQEHYYTGLTDDVDKRLIEHNNGQSIHTNKFKPWKIKNIISFTDPQKAFEFERYLNLDQGVLL